MLHSEHYEGIKALTTRHHASRLDGEGTLCGEGCGAGRKEGQGGRFVGITEQGETKGRRDTQMPSVWIDGGRQGVKLFASS